MLDEQSQIQLSVNEAEDYFKKKAQDMKWRNRLKLIRVNAAPAYIHG